MSKPKTCFICKLSGNEGYFSLPTKPDQRKLWIDVCNIAENHGDVRICFRHFDVPSEVQSTTRCYKLKPGEFKIRLKKI